MADCDSHFLQGRKILVGTQFTHKIENFSLLLVSGFDGILRNLFPSQLVKVFRNASHKAKLRDEDDRKLVVTFPPALDLQQRLLFVANCQIVLPFVVLPQVADAILKNDSIHILEKELLDFVVGSFAVIGHDDLVGQFNLQNMPPFLSIFALMHLVEAIDKLQNGLVADDLLGRVHLQEEPVLKQHEGRAVAVEHHQVVD